MDEQNKGLKKPRIRKAPVSQREKVEKARVESEKISKKSRLGSGAKSKAKSAGSFLGKEYYMPMPNNRVGRFLNKRRSFVPKYFKESWVELKQVTWPGRKETWRLTLAVFIFAIVFGTLVGLLDKGLDILFKDIILE